MLGSRHVITFGAKKLTLVRTGEEPVRGRQVEGCHLLRDGAQAAAVGEGDGTFGLGGLGGRGGRG